jgi:RimJ/RimL family protein N-acetyltransferase
MEIRIGSPSAVSCSCPQLQAASRLAIAAILLPYYRQNPSMHLFLETARLQLRRFTADDVENLVALDGDPAVMHFINGGRPTPREEIENDVLPAFLGHYERHEGYGFWAATEKSTGRFVGWFHLRPEEGAPPGEVELGYRLLRSAWGRGYASEGSRALIDKGFAELGVQRVVASTMVVNVASRRVMEKAGLRFVRAFHQPWPDYIEGEEQGDVEYALLRSEWERPAVQLHRCGTPWKFGPCWRVQKALDDQGVPYDVVRGPWRPARRAVVIEGTGQPLYPAVRFADGSWYREESKDMARTIADGRLREKQPRA